MRGRRPRPLDEGSVRLARIPAAWPLQAPPAPSPPTPTDELVEARRARSRPGGGSYAGTGRRFCAGGHRCAGRRRPARFRRRGGRRAGAARPGAGARLADLSRSRLQALIRDGRVAVDGAVVRDPSLKVRPGAAIALAMPPAAPAEPRGEAIALAVVYEDEDLIVIDKPAGLVVHPAAGHDTRHARQRAHRPLRREPVRHRRRAAAGHRAPARQGHERAARGRQDRPRPSRRWRRSSPITAAPARSSAPIWPSSGACPSRAAARSTRPSAAARRTARRWRSSPTSRGRQARHALRRRGALRGPARAPRGEPRPLQRSRPGARTRSASTWPISATRCSATRPTGPASRPRRTGCRREAQRGARRPRPAGAACGRARLRAPARPAKPCASRANRRPTCTADRTRFAAGAARADTAADRVSST